MCLYGHILLPKVGSGGVGTVAGGVPVTLVTACPESP